LFEGRRRNHARGIMPDLEKKSAAASPNAVPTAADEKFKAKIGGCWLGKAIGGTLGTPHEGKPGPLELTFYDPMPDGMLPNDDLDLQIVWLEHLLGGRFRQVTPEILAEAWEKFVQFPWDEYGIARRNRALGLRGERQGSHDNFFGECMGAAIRSELWACIAPGDPNRAAGFAWADAVVDHAGEGVWAEVFHAVVQSAAFTNNGMEELLAVGLSMIPADSRVARAIRDTVRWWRQEHDWRRVRSRIIFAHGRANFTDVAANLAFEVLGWLAGDGDFARSICIAVNCGRDTDCTGATLGALLGILDPNGIPERWSAPIGERIVLSPGIVGLMPPASLTALTEATLQLSAQLAGAFPAIPPVAPIRPTGPEGPFFCEMAQGHSFTPEFTLRNPQSRPIHGHWLQFAPAEFEADWLLLELSFDWAGSGNIRLLAYADVEIYTWVDESPAVHFTEDDLRADPFLAPSFHRAGKAACMLTGLGRGRHRLNLAIARTKEGRAVNLVFGLGDPVTNQWLAEPFGFQKKAADGRR